MQVSPSVDDRVEVDVPSPIEDGGGRVDIFRRVNFFENTNQI